MASWEAAMAESPSIERMDAERAGPSLGAVLDHVAVSGARVLVERDGAPVAAIIPAGDLERLFRLERERQADFAVIAEMRAAFEGISPEDVEREAARALAEVRAERRARSPSDRS
jgi:PHD/YefM family antitoxin component YafN of YafNO toxin-antitoxin module